MTVIFVVAVPFGVRGVPPRFWSSTTMVNVAAPLNSGVGSYRNVVSAALMSATEPRNVNIVSAVPSLATSTGSNVRPVVDVNVIVPLVIVRVTSISKSSPSAISTVSVASFPANTNDVSSLIVKVAGAVAVGALFTASMTMVMTSVSVPMTGGTSALKLPRSLARIDSVAAPRP